MGKLQRRKGSAYENHVANCLRNSGFPEAKRHLEFQFAEALGRDLDHTKPFAIQCKHWNKTPPITVLNELITDSEYYIRVAFLKKSQMKDSPGMHVVVMDADWFLAIVSLLQENDLLKELTYEI